MSDNVVETNVYPELYRFAAENIDSATTQLEASIIADNYKGVKLCNNEEEFYDDIHFDDWINGCTQVFLDEHDITLEEYEKMNESNICCFNCYKCKNCINCEGCHGDGCKTYFCSQQCQIRKCAISKGYNTCAECSEMESCEILKMITGHNDQAKNNLKNLK